MVASGRVWENEFRAKFSLEMMSLDERQRKLLGEWKFEETGELEILMKVAMYYKLVMLFSKQSYWGS